MRFSECVFGLALLMDKAGENSGGSGGGAPSGEPAPGGESNNNNGTDLSAENAALKAQLAKYQNQGSGESGNQGEHDQDLLEKSRKQREEADKKKTDTKSLENALRFEMESESWIKQNQNLLPKDIQDIFTTAKSETYDSPVEKDSALKSGIIQSFFSVQDNLDLLTPGLKNQLEDYLKLTKNGKQDKAQSIYSNIFEPAFEMLKRVKKAEALQKGHGDGSDDAYKNKLMQGSRKHYLGEKANA